MIQGDEFRNPPLADRDVSGRLALGAAQIAEMPGAGADGQRAALSLLET